MIENNHIFCINLFVHTDMSVRLIGILCCIGIWTVLDAQTSLDSRQSSKDVLPPSFLIGENEQAYDRILEKYTKNLVAVCGNDNEKAFLIWSSVLADMAESARNAGVDLNGLKLWMNVFFNDASGIDYIVYYPKPNSKNMDFARLTEFFGNFCRTYRMKDKIGERCLINASATFPLMSK